MILYSKSGDFIGMGKDELSFLGYEDLDEFKNVHKDVADMFINKPGYIFKFKNFSWIDYTLHSGAPKKSVIIKLKNGNEVEVPIKIKEIFLYASDNNEIQYAVEFSNSMSQNASMQQSESSFIQGTPTYEEISIATKEEDIQELSIVASDDFQENIDNDFSMDFDSSLTQDEPQMKLKPNENIFEEEVEPTTSATLSSDYESPTTSNEFLLKEDLDETKLSIANNFNEEFTLKEETKVELSSSFTDLSEDYKEELKEETLIQIKNDEDKELTFSANLEENETELEEKIEFDLFDCAEQLDLDISTIAELIEEYIEKVNQSIPDIIANIEENDTAALENNIYTLKGISDNLRIMEFSKALDKILQAQNKELKEKELNKFQKIVAQFKGELI